MPQILWGVERTFYFNWFKGIKRGHLKFEKRNIFQHVPYERHKLKMHKSQLYLKFTKSNQI